MDEQTRKRSKLINTLNIPFYTASMIACEHEAVFYKELWGYTFYTINNAITFRIDDIKPRFVVIGLVGVSDDDELIKSFIEVMNFLGYKVDIQEVFSIFNSEYKNIKYKKN